MFISKWLPKTHSHLYADETNIDALQHLCCVLANWCQPFCDNVARYGNWQEACMIMHLAADKTKLEQLLWQLKRSVRAVYLYYIVKTWELQCSKKVFDHFLPHLNISDQTYYGFQTMPLFKGKAVQYVDHSDLWNCSTIEDFFLMQYWEYEGGGGVHQCTFEFLIQCF